MAYGQVGFAVAVQVTCGNANRTARRSRENARFREAGPGTAVGLDQVALWQKAEQHGRDHDSPTSQHSFDDRHFRETKSASLNHTHPFELQIINAPTNPSLTSPTNAIINAPPSF